MSSLPDEVILEILSRLPVKPLLCFRCVSKPWLALIDSPQFIKLHLKQSLKTTTNLSLILGDGYLYSSDFDSLDTAIELDHPLKTPHYETEIVGSCNGLLCLSNKKEDVALWNPSTRKYRKLPVTTLEFAPDGYDFCQYTVSGFGYDETSDDYKVVRSVRLYLADNLSSGSEVYSLKNDSWRRLPDYPYNLRYLRAFAMLVSGALHWLVTSKAESDRTNLILAFDLGVEEYRLVPRPDFSDKDCHMNVGVLGGCLTIYGSNYINRLDVWVMKDYGVKESWTKLFTAMEPFSILDPFWISSFQDERPVAYSKSGGEVLLEQFRMEDKNQRLVWYDLKNNKKVKNVKIQGSPDKFHADICCGSLVPLGGNREGNTKKQRAGEKQNRKKR
jgi:F-box interacting protein|uniref:F-box domain-containing protein n=1 Tax=Fagus sylvatica TaxID=28930 RepID=A0A2N9I8J2_FAGSY